MNDPFVKIQISWPGFYLSFESTQERVSRVMEYVLKEALDAEKEFEESKLPKSIPSAPLT